MSLHERERREQRAATRQARHVVRAEKSAPRLLRNAERLTRKQEKRARLGGEQDATFYNKVYRDSAIRGDDLPEVESKYLPSWRRVVEWVGPGESIIDLGCGHGGFARVAIDAMVHYKLGVDFSEVAIEWARERNPEYADKFTIANIFDPDIFGFVDFDTAVILETLEHLDNDIDLLASIPGGKRVILSVPSYGGRAHVRFFDTLEDAVARYSAVLTITQAEAIVVGANGQTLWLIDGVRHE